MEACLDCQGQAGHDVCECVPMVKMKSRAAWDNQAPRTSFHSSAIFGLLVPDLVHALYHQELAPKLLITRYMLSCMPSITRNMLLITKNMFLVIDQQELVLVHALDHQEHAFMPALVHALYQQELALKHGLDYQEHAFLHVLNQKEHVLDHQEHALMPVLVHALRHQKIALEHAPGYQEHALVYPLGHQ